MAKTQIRGNVQIMDETIENGQISPSAAVELSKLETPVVAADGRQDFTADQSMGGFSLTDLADPTNAQDAATRAWVLAQLSGIPSGASATEVRVATTGNITLSGTQTIDGVAVSAGNRVFVRAQTSADDNGIYVVSGGAWARAADADTWDELTGLLVVVTEGTTYADTLHLVTTDAGGTLDTDPVTSVQLPSPTDIVAGAGLARSGQTINVVATDSSLTVNANDLQVNVNSSGGLEVSSGVRVKLNGTTLDRSSSGMKVADAGITETHLATSVAGNGLAGGAGTALSVNVDGSTLEINSDSLRVKDAGITSAKLGTGARRVVRETPTGSVNGSNTSFTLANTPASGTEEVYLNGILQEPGAGNDYTISTNTITYLTAPLTGDRLRVSYMY